MRLYITNNGIIYEPVVEGEITWETERFGSPGILSFTVLKDSVINFQEGNLVQLYVGDVKTFYGFVFTKKRSTSKAGAINVTAYDQLRYLKNKDAYIYPEAMTATQLIRALAHTYRLQAGELEDTGFIIPRRVESNQTLFDTIQTALDETLMSTRQLHVLYDDFGKLTLRNLETMKLPILIAPGTASDFDYSTSIDSGTYNQVKLYYDNQDTHKREGMVDFDPVNIEKWGVLQLCESVQNKGSIQQKVKDLLKFYNMKTRSLSVKKAFGDIRVRGGSGVMVSLNLGDIKVNTYMLVEKVKHTITEESHFMDLTLRGCDAYV
ncbi:hydrolase [Aminipila butyrica]|uniref:Hydrolase n=1 Tax=Aminipila butyrica TaxID=433296 RepID=A0A858C1Y5_9FIRM|nr:hydrolase [Aminipila butyrica]